MAERVQVIVDAKDNASGVLRGLTANMGALGGAVEHVTGASINWGNVTAQATRLISDVLKEAFTVATEYASAVRDIALASGTSAEEASRLLQVLDDFEIQANDVTTATRAMTRNGLAPTIETIAQLSDEYLKLNTAEERNAFITENLGKGGAKWANVLKEGSAAILELNAGVNEALILNDEQIRQYEEMRLNQDEFNDRVMALQITLINGLVPAINASVDALSEWFTLLQNGQIGINNVTSGTLPLFITKLEELTSQSSVTADSQTLLSDAVRISGTAAAESSADFNKLLSVAQKLNDATREQISLVGYQALTDAFQKSDGGISPEEAQTLQEAGEALGIFNAGASKSASSILTMAAAVDTGTASVEKYIAMLNSIPTSITTQISAVTVSGTQGSLLAGADAYNNSSTIPQAGGGDTVAGQTYLVGERGPELFKAPSNGEIIPNDKFGGSNNFYGATVYISNDSMNIMDDR